MLYRSTRGDAPAVGFSEAVERGLAADGGLYVPQTFPTVDVAALSRIEPFADFAAALLAPFLAADPLCADLDAICAEAFDFRLALEPLDRDTAVLELFHGPTAAFKDFGARFLAGCLTRIDAPGGDTTAPRTVIVATSGDTGGAVAAAFHDRPGFRLAVLYPEGGVSPRQEIQLTCWGGNVRAFAIAGRFDDCQRLAKQAFGDPEVCRTARPTSANSISVGRLLPQLAFHAWAAARYRGRWGVAPGVVVPSGNLGDAFGAFWALRLGFPLRRVVLATNANRTLVDWFEGGAWRPRPSRRTPANAMDVGDPSNMERLLDLYGAREALLADSEAHAVDDETIRTTIADEARRTGRVWCPHTATAIHVRRGLVAAHWIVVATAHPAKFDDVVEPLIGRRVEPPPRLAALLDRPTRSHGLPPDFEALRAALREWDAERTD